MSLLPPRVGVYNGVAVRDIPFTERNDHHPDHKQVLVDAVQKFVGDGDDVVSVGGGRGVVETHAARQGATVLAFEAAQEKVDILRETARLNDVPVTASWAQVGGAYDIYGTADGVRHLPPGELRGNVLLLDCEGAEADILPRPEFETVIVETHPRFGASTDDVLELLDGDAEIYGPDPVDGDVVVRT